MESSRPFVSPHIRCHMCLLQHTLTRRRAKSSKTTAIAKIEWDASPWSIRRKKMGILSRDRMLTPVDTNCTYMSRRDAKNDGQSCETRPTSVSENGWVKLVCLRAMVWPGYLGTARGIFSECLVDCRHDRCDKKTRNCTSHDVGKQFGLNWIRIAGHFRMIF